MARSNQVADESQSLESQNRAGTSTAAGCCRADGLFRQVMQLKVLDVHDECVSPLCQPTPTFAALEAAVLVADPVMADLAGRLEARDKPLRAVAWHPVNNRPRTPTNAHRVSPSAVDHSAPVDGRIHLRLNAYLVGHHPKQMGCQVPNSSLF